jgi:Zn-dependent protease with chaperone function
MTPRRTLLLLLAIALTAAALAGCQTDPITGESTYNWFTVQDDIKFGQDAMQQFLDYSREQGWYPGDPDMQAKCDEILARVTRVSHLPDLPWAIYYTECPDVNAFCLPGGQIMVFAGIWKMIETDDELAAVIAHECTHATGRHGTERMSTVLTAQLIGAAAQIAAQASGGQGAAQASDAINKMIAVLVPVYSRSQENEADHWGMLYMAKAGFDPNAAVAVWQRAAQTNSTPIDIYADHPSNADRAAALATLLPDALDYYGRALAGEDFTLTAGPAGQQPGNTPTPPDVAQLPAAFPIDPAGLQFQEGTLDTSNYAIDEEKGIVTVVIANNTGRNIKSFTLNIAFYDQNGNIITTDRSKQKQRLDNGNLTELTFTMPLGTVTATFDPVEIKYD